MGEAYYKSWTAVAERYGLIPAAIDYRDLSVIDPSYDLFPEYPNAAFDLWFLTNDTKYRHTAYNLLLAWSCARRAKRPRDTRRLPTCERCR